MSDDDDFILDDDEEDAPAAADADPWIALIVDDEPAIHDVTKMAARDLRYAGRALHFLSAHSAAEAQAILRERRDVAFILLDVVMESDDAGLKMARWIREELGNSAVRIILRTGQPGQAPERSVILDYDINDYKEKTELTSQKLFTALISALRSYEQLHALEHTRAGLRKIIDSSATLDRVMSLRGFADGVLTQIGALIGGLSHGAIVASEDDPWGDAVFSAHAVIGPDRRIGVLSAIGDYAELVASGDLAGHPGLADRIVAMLDREQGEVESHEGPDDLRVLSLRTPSNRKIVIAFQRAEALNALDRQLIELFCVKIVGGFETLALFNQLRSTHEATIMMLADIAEYRDQTTGEHVRRVADLCARTVAKMAEKGTAAPDPRLPHRIRLASMLHDVGKIATPDAILNKPGKLDDGEWAEMRRHAEVGARILRQAEDTLKQSEFFSLAADIAQAHHERFDGKGYPAGLSGDLIPLGARILAVADVYDALTHARPYKEAWPLDKALAEIRSGAGGHFDPAVVDAFEAVLAEEETVRRSPSPADAATSD